MGNRFNTTDRTGKKSKELRLIYHDPIIIPHDPQPTGETPPPADGGDWTGRVFIGGLIFVLLGLCWLAPAWTESVLKNLIRQIFYFAGQ